MIHGEILQPKGAHLSSDQTPGSLGWNMVELFMGCCMLIKLETEISHFCRYNGCDINTVILVKPRSPTSPSVRWQFRRTSCMSHVMSVS